MGKTKKVKWLAFLLACFLLVGCVQQPRPPEGETQKFYVENITYELPRGWEDQGDQVGGYSHFPPDGGALYVSKSNYLWEDFTQPESAYRHAYLERDRMMNSVEEPELVEENGDVWHTSYSVSSWFTGQVEGRRINFYTRIFSYNRFIYAFLFAFPNAEESTLHSKFAEIEESIWLPPMGRSESE